MAAASYALIVFSIWGDGHGEQIAALCLGYASAIIVVGAFAASVFLLFGVWARGRRGAPCSSAALVREFVSERWRIDRCVALWQPLLTFIILMTAFTFFKQAVLPHAGFGYGPAIAVVDRALFGVDPWRITHAVFASPWWSQVIDLAYHAWFAPMTLGVVLCAFARPGSILAWRYMLAYCLMWIVQGSIMAYSFPAAGPVFFANFHQEPVRFAALNDLLASQDAVLRAHGAPGLMALHLQHHLLHIFQDGTIAVGGGISAMPSLHNAMAILFACATWHFSPRYGRAMTGYAAIIWIGSIHLGWHYALDGIVALVATIILWKLTGVLGDAAQRDARLWRWPPPLLAPGFAAARSTLSNTDEQYP